MRALPGQIQRVPPGPRPIARGDAATEQRRRILRVTADLVAKRGYQGTTTELIVRRAKVGYGTFYKFFADKEACLLALFDETLQRASAELAAIYGSGGERTPWAERVAAVIEAFYAQIAADPAIARACLVESLTAGPKLLVRYDAELARLSQILKPGRREAEGAAILPDTLENTLTGGILWIPYQLLVTGEADQLPAKVPEAIQFALRPYLGDAAAIEVAQRQTAIDTG